MRLATFTTGDGDRVGRSSSRRPPPRSPTWDDIDPHHDVTVELDYEGELGVIIGIGGSGISRDRAWEHVWGLTVIDDVTARDLATPSAAEVVPLGMPDDLLDRPAQP